MEEDKRAFKILTGKPIGKTPLGRPRRRWEDNIRMNLEDILLNQPATQQQSTTSQDIHSNKN